MVVDAVITVFMMAIALLCEGYTGCALLQPVPVDTPSPTLLRDAAGWLAVLSWHSYLCGCLGLPLVESCATFCAVRLRRLWWLLGRQACAGSATDFF